VNDVTVPNFTNGWASEFILNTSNWTGLVFNADGNRTGSATVTDFAIGMRLKKRMFGVEPFAEGSVGLQSFAPSGLAKQILPSYFLGTGVDIRITSKIAIRPIDLSYVHSSYNTQSSSSSNIQKNALSGFRLQAGVLFNFSFTSPTSNPQATCDPYEVEVGSGAKVKIGVTASGFAGRRLSYSYKSTGGKVVGNQNSATVDTTGVGPGTYMVTADVSERGLHAHRLTAKCQANFTVRESSPSELPTPAIPERAAAPRSNEAPVNAGEPVPALSASTAAEAPVVKETAAPRASASKTAVAKEPVMPGESTSTVAETPAADGAVTAGASVTVEKGPAASPASSSAALSAGVVKEPTGFNEKPTFKAKAPRATRFGAIEFWHDRRRPTRVDNQAKAELDRYADALAATPDARGVVIGYARAGKSKDDQAAKIGALRAVNTKQYLTKDKGVDPARIEVRSGVGRGKKADLWIVPAGAGLAAARTSVLDEKKVAAIPRVPLRPKTPLEAKPKKQAN
jgi:outer membrane protein OmpA-like peptidoglycan-associated protein